MIFFLGDTFFESLFHVMGMSLSPLTTRARFVIFSMGLLLKLKGLHEGVHQGIPSNKQPSYRLGVEGINEIN